MITTKMLTVLDDIDDLANRLNGDEVWPILGDAVTPEQAERVVANMKGLPKYWACDLKAICACIFLSLPFSKIAVGSMLVYSSDMKSYYGYYYNPPFEFHAWIEMDNGIVIDFSAPGVIEKGLYSYDSQGVFINGRKPVIIAGQPPNWIVYTKNGSYFPK